MFAFRLRMFIDRPLCEGIYVCVSLCVCACVCTCDRETQRERCVLHAYCIFRCTCTVYVNVGFMCLSAGSVCLHQKPQIASVLVYLFTQNVLDS